MREALGQSLGKLFADAACDADRLAGRWQELNLPWLPDEFSWVQISWFASLLRFFPLTRNL